MEFLVAQILSGVSLGGQYALIAIGYTMVYGILRLINFAHGDVFMCAGLMMVFMCASLPVYVSIPLMLVLTVLLGFVIERAAYKPLRSAPRMSVMISAIGVSYLLQNLALLVFGPNPMSFPSFVSIPSISLFDGQLILTGETIVTVLANIIIMLVLTFFTSHTKMGKAMRAVSEDAGAAQLMGININNTISFTFAVGSALAGIGSVLYCCAYPKATPTMGSMLGLKAFVAAVLGGIGSIPGPWREASP